MIYVHKILPLLVSPLGLALAFLLLALVVRRRWPIVFAATTLVVFSLPIVAGQLWAWLEGPAPKRPINSLPKVEAIVVLSGMLGSPAALQGGYEWGDPDRFFGGLEAFKAGKSPLLVFTGGRLPWERENSNEGTFLASAAVQMGVPPNAIRVTENVQNTAEEAIEVRRLLGPKARKILLVTSAFHMRRATELFKKQNFEVVSFSVDFKAGGGLTSVLDFIPSAGALRASSDAIREWLGRAYYTLKK